MKITFTARHFNASEDLKDYAYETVEKLNNFFDHISSVEILLEPSQDVSKPQKAEIKLNVPQKFLTATIESQTYEQSIRDAVENLSRQLKRYKEKRFSKH